MRTVLTRLATIALGSLRIWRKRVPYVAMCTTAVLFVGLAIRLWITYLPAQAGNVVRRDRNVGETVATVQRAAGDLPRLEELARRTAQAVLPSVVSARNPFQKPLEVGRHQKNYASGVIITADGIVLSQLVSRLFKSMAHFSLGVQEVKELRFVEALLGLAAQAGHHPA